MQSNHDKMVLNNAMIKVDYNSFTDPEKIKPLEFKNAVLNKNGITVTLPAASVIMLTLK